MRSYNKYMSIELPQSPEPVAMLAERCYSHVKHRLGFELDYENETLSVLDHFVNDVLIFMLSLVEV